MPYIKSNDRGQFERGLESLNPKTAGELNYVITKICLKYFNNEVNHSYQGINDIIGVLACATQEFYRRVAVPYEVTKQELNGDVYRV